MTKRKGIGKKVPQANQQKKRIIQTKQINERLQAFFSASKSLRLIYWLNM